MPTLRTIAAALLLALAAPVAASADRLAIPTGGPAAGFKSVAPNVATALGNEFITFADYLYFVADDNINGSELWRTNGTNDSTTMVANLNSGANSSSPHGFTIVGNRMYFNFSNGNGRSDSVSYIDASAPTTVLEAKAKPEPVASPAIAAAGTLIGAVNGKAILSRYSAAAGECGCYAVYAAGDSTDTFVKINADNGSIDGALFSPAATAKGWLYYSRSNTQVGPGQGSEPWRTNGSTVELVKDLSDGPGDNDVNIGSSPGAFVATSGHVYFTATDGHSGTELWVTDPDNKADTHIVHEHHANLTGTSINDPGQVANGDTLYYVPADDPDTGPEVWRTDGTEAGTRVVKDITPGAGGFSTPTSFPFKAGIGLLRGSDIYYSDGTAAGTALLNSADGDGYGPNNPVVLGDQAYFVAGASPFGQAIWRTDGTALGTFPLSAGGFDGTPATSGCPCAQTLAVLGNKVIFFGRDPSTNNTGYVKVFAIDTGQPDEIRAATAPPILTVALGGTRLDASQGSWSGRPTTYSYTWLRNGQPIDWPDYTYYFLTPADAGQKISVRVTTTGIGAPRFVSAESAPFTGAGATPTPSPSPTASPSPSPSPTLTVSKKAKLKGKAKVGSKLKLTLPKFAQSGVKLTFKWLANGKTIKKQTKSSLKLKKAQKGKKISLKITVRKTGFKTLTLTVKLPGNVKGK